MIEQEEEEFEYDVYYRGTKQQLFAFLYPLTGPAGALFKHLRLSQLHFHPDLKSFEGKYEAVDFENIDREKQQIVYRSTPIPTQSNYFYSLYQPDYKCFLWQNVRNFVEMRPRNTDAALKDRPASGEDARVELQTVGFEQAGSKAREIIENAVVMSAKENWEVSKEEYLQHLAK